MEVLPGSADLFQECGVSGAQVHCQVVDIQDLGPEVQVREVGKTA